MKHTFVSKYPYLNGKLSMIGSEKIKRSLSTKQTHRTSSRINKEKVIDEKEINVTL